jgi:hypothetical protein
MTDVDDFLSHYGVKGMKWGVIRKDPSAGPSRREVRTTAKYLEKGFALEVAEKKARGRIAVENALLVAGGTALAAGAGYAAYRQAERVFGSVNLPMGTPVHHVNVHGPNLDIKDKPMFVAFNKKDQKFYDSVFANFARNRAAAENIYKSTLETTTDIKAPSNFEAKRLYKEFSKKFKPGMDYSEFNYSFNGEGLGNPQLKKEFSKFMQGKGYNAMIDNFDTMKSTRIRTTKPTILFDPTRSIKKVNDILLDNDKVMVSSLKYQLMSSANNAALSPKAPILGALVGLGAFGKFRSTERPREIQVDAYKKQYPGTKLSDAEIYNLVGSQPTT